MYNLNNFKTFELSNMHSFEIEIIVIAVSDFVAGGDEERGSAEGARGEAATLCLDISRISIISRIYRWGAATSSSSSMTSRGPCVMKSSSDNRSSSKVMVIEIELSTNPSAFTFGNQSRQYTKRAFKQINLMWNWNAKAKIITDKRLA